MLLSAPPVNYRKTKLKPEEALREEPEGAHKSRDLLKPSGGSGEQSRALS